MRVKIGFVLIAVAMAAMWIVPTATAQDASHWKWVCHHRGNGEYNLLITSNGSADRHLANHDGDWQSWYTPGDPPPCPY